MVGDAVVAVRVSQQFSGRKLRDWDKQENASQSAKMRWGPLGRLISQGGHTAMR